MKNMAIQTENTANNSENNIKIQAPILVVDTDIPEVK